MHYEMARTYTGAILYSGPGLSAVLASNIPAPYILKYGGKVRACNDVGCSARTG